MVPYCTYYNVLLIVLYLCLVTRVDGSPLDELAEKDD